MTMTSSIMVEELVVPWADHGGRGAEGLSGRVPSSLPLLLSLLILSFQAADSMALRGLSYNSGFVIYQLCDLG